MIVKVQISEFPYNERVLIYSKDKKVFYETNVTPDLLRRMKGRRKVFFHAYYDKNHVLQLLSEAKKQKW